MVLSPSEKAILTTLSYGDIFHFPLTKEELWKYLISPIPLSPKSFEAGLRNVSSYLGHKDGYYYFKGQEAYVAVREENKKQFEKKMKIARFAASYLSYIPTVLFIGVSGSLAIGNAGRQDDIDLFIITKKNTVFTTRLFVSLILEALGLRRRKNDKNPANKVCVNLFVDEKCLHWPSSRQDIYIAHEIVQLRVIFERKNTYNNFLLSNNWVKKFLPNALKDRVDEESVNERRDYAVLYVVSWIVNFFPLRIVIGWLQKHFIQKSRTVEIVTERILAFHPNDYRIKILKEIGLKQEKLRSLTKE